MGCPLLCTALLPHRGLQHPPSALPTTHCHSLGGLQCPDSLPFSPGLPFSSLLWARIAGSDPLCPQPPRPEELREGGFQHTKLPAAPDNTVRSNLVPARSSPPYGPCHCGPGPEPPGAGREGAACHQCGQEGLMGVMVQGAGGQSLPWAWGAGGQPAGSVSAPRPVPKGLSCTPALSQPGTLWGRSPLPPLPQGSPHRDYWSLGGGHAPPCPAPALTSPRRLQAARPPRPCPPGPAHVRMEPGARPLLALCLASCLLAPGKRQRGRRGALTPTQPWAWGKGP